MQEKINLEKHSVNDKFLLKKELNNKFGLNKRYQYLYMKKEAKNYLHKVESNELNHSKIFINIQFLKEIRSYRGVRHRAKLPTRGQRTHTNAKTTKKKKTIR